MTESVRWHVTPVDDVYAIVNTRTGATVAQRPDANAANVYVTTLESFYYAEVLTAAANKMPYGDVTYADPGYQKDGKKRYPLDSAARVRSAWSYIHQADNRRFYTAAQLSAIEGRIRAAAKKFGIDIAG